MTSVYERINEKFWNRYEKDIEANKKFMAKIEAILREEEPQNES